MLEKKNRQNYAILSLCYTKYCPPPPRESFIYNVLTNYATDKPRERLRKLWEPCKRETSARSVESVRSQANILTFQFCLVRKWCKMWCKWCKSTPIKTFLTRIKGWRLRCGIEKVTVSQLSELNEALRKLYRLESFMLEKKNRQNYAILSLCYTKYCPPPPRESFIYNVLTNYATDKPRERLRKLWEPCKRETSARSVESVRSQANILTFQFCLVRKWCKMF